ncbi:hypothetical protein BGZ61DRAFT_533827 [Ilyonectria robusta]|uniref:uncharacterized protein n=1 Tax=Ilyonectria robusta TaxID=1079257 RepID=UPI001E8E02B7|nr:uncharacterized protein BGZ61DRAFT_533827 [Ilyonectria robusta]KAH8686270.1 hypothetical protein BGZ61DRAFT_533827 [Ilyonectria robusta]
MRYIAIATAALGMLRVSEANVMCNPSVTGYEASQTPTGANKIVNGDFSNGLEGFNTSGSVEHIPLAGSDGCSDSDSVIQMIAVPQDEQSTSVYPVESTGGSISKRDSWTSSSMSTTIKSLTVGAKYAVEFYYYVVYSPKANTCRIQATWDGVNIGNSSYFPVVLIIGSDWKKFNGTATASKANGVLKVVVACTAGTAQVYIDSISVTKTTAAAVVSTSSTSSKAIATITSTLTSSSSAPSLTTSAKATTTSATAATTLSSQANTSSSAAASSTASSAAGSSSSAGSTSSDSGSSSNTGTSSVSGSSSNTASSSDTGSGTSNSASSSGSGTSSSSAASSSSTGALHGAGATVDATILVIAADSDTAAAGSLGLLAYGIPYETFVVSADGSDLPPLSSSSTHGNYGGIIILSSIAVSKSSGWGSALTDNQWTALYAYQTDYNVRMVRINEYPGSKFGTTPVGSGCCDSSADQSISFTDVSDFPTANLKAKATVSTSGLWHVPASITDTSTTKQIAKFGISTGYTSETVAAVINNFNGREQFVWFIGWAPAWSLTSNYLQHAHIHWLTRGLFLGKRKTHLSCQIDDVQIATELYYPTGLDDFKIQIADLEAHVTWQNSIVSRMPSGSVFWLELAHNGNGDIITSTLKDQSGTCDPEDAVYYDSPNATALEFQKELGTGTDLWPTGYETYSWSKACSGMDSFSSWFTKTDNLNQFAHLSHTFSHMSLNNATYHDTSREIKFNQAWMKQLGIDQATLFSAHGLVPPAITGLHNGDAIKAWMDNGIVNVVGDNTRPLLRNPNNPYWPLTSTVAANGYDGLTIVPRFSTAIYFNCHTMECTLNEWIATSAGKGTYFDLLASSKASTIRNLLALQSDPYMFHQANMHQTTVSSITIGTQSGQMSLVMSWTETMVQEMMRLTNWPMQSLKHDDIAQYFLDRQALDNCNPKLSYSFSGDGTKLKAVTVTADGNSCSVPVPVTIPSGSVSASGGSIKSDVVGSEPPIQWVTLSGSPVTLSLSSPISISF